ncbi:MAG: helix-turn-helix domain-containing protein [Actinomycetota bacterium]
MLGPPLQPLPAPEPTTGRLVEGWWSAVVSGRGMVVPDGAVDLLWSPRAGPFVAGPDVEPRPVELTPGDRLVGVRLRAGVAAQLLGIGLDRVTGQAIALDAVLAPGELDRLGDRLATAEPPAAQAWALTEALDRWIPDDWEPDREVTAALVALRSDRPIEPGGIGDRQLRRRFTASLGFGPAFYRRLVRLDRFTELLDRWPERSLGELAASAGYADQAHLGRDCRRLLDTTPGRLRHAA